MIYTGSGRYAIRALVCLAANSTPEQPLPANSVAEAEGIPPFYLAKVLQDLARAGLVSSTRGRRGGFHLGRPAEEITLIEVIRSVEDPGRLEKRCVLDIADCSDEAPCPLHDTWKEFRDQAVRALRTLTLSDMVREMQRKQGETRDDSMN